MSPAAGPALDPAVHARDAEAGGAAVREWNGQISGIRPSDMQHVQTFLAEYPITEVLN